MPASSSDNRENKAEKVCITENGYFVLNSGIFPLYMLNFQCVQRFFRAFRHFLPQMLQTFTFLHHLEYAIYANRKPGIITTDYTRLAARTAVSNESVPIEGDKK